MAGGLRPGGDGDSGGRCRGAAPAVAGMSMGGQCVLGVGGSPYMQGMIYRPPYGYVWGGGVIKNSYSAAGLL